MIPGARGHELGDFASGEKLRLASESRCQRDFGEVLDDFHAVKGGEQIGSTSDRAVIGEKKRVIVRNVGFEHGAEIGSAGSGVANQRNFAEAYDDFRKKRLIETLTRGSETGGGGRMRMADGLDIRAHLIKEQVHAGFGRNLAIDREDDVRSISMMTRSSGVIMPLFRQVGVVRMRLASRRTERLPSPATMWPRSYNQRPTRQMS